MAKVTRQMVDKAARALYRHAGWERAWKDIDPSGRRRFREAALEAILAAFPTAFPVKTRGQRKR